MKLNQAPIKTLKGLQEVGSRAYGLPTDMRRILIMINGHYTVDELNRKFAKFGKIQSLLNQLEQDGFISPNPTYTPPPETSLRLSEISHQPNRTVRQLHASPPSHPHSPTDNPHHPHAEFNLEKAKGFIRFVLFGAMGPTAERRINRIDATTNPEDLRVELDTIRDMLPNVLSKKEAQQAWRQLEPIMCSLDMLHS